MKELCYLVETAIDYAFKDKFVLNMYLYAKSAQLTKKDMTQFIQSSTAAELSDLCLELDEYIKGGSDNEHKQIREGYGHIPKPRARKIRNYLYGILEDALRYERDKRPGRKRGI
mgnify:FL=1|jgi:hypothetical protein|tara:strand:- start:36562 stop:36903 length:342 start_codon:yes stop_codon:yes gene_type:complete